MAYARVGGGGYYGIRSYMVGWKHCVVQGVEEKLWHTRVQGRRGGGELESVQARTGGKGESKNW